jgi:hypothetical protein
MSHAILKLQESEKRAEHESALAEAKRREQGFEVKDHPSSQAVN